jgi:hypothetical protein
MKAQMTQGKWHADNTDQTDYRGFIPISLLIHAIEFNILICLSAGIRCIRVIRVLNLCVISQPPFI